MYTIGIDIGGTKSVTSLGYWSEGKIEVLQKGISYPTANYSAEEIIYRLCEEIKGYQSKINHDEIVGIGISCGGPLDAEKGVILSPPNLPGWDEIHIVDIVENETGLKTWLMNDANACALAEWRFGAGKGCSHMAFMTFGTGLGSGLILNRRLYQGRNDMAGEVGHIRLRKDGPIGYGKKGSFEGFCSGGGIAQLAQMMVKKAKENHQETCLSEAHLSAKDVAEAALRKDKVALSIFEKSGDMLGEGLAIMIDLLNLERIVIGGIFMRCQDWIYPFAARVIEQEACSQSADCEILASQLGESIGDMAALSIPLYERNLYE